MHLMSGVVTAVIIRTERIKIEKCCAVAFCNYVANDFYGYIIKQMEQIIMRIIGTYTRIVRKVTSTRNFIFDLIRNLSFFVPLGL